MKVSFLKKNSQSMRVLKKSEVILLSALFIILEGYLLVNRIIIPKWNDYKINLEELTKRDKVLNQLKIENSNIKKFKEDEEALKYNLNKIVKELPPFISQQDIIVTVDGFAKKRDVSMDAINFEKDTAFLVNNFISKGNNEKSESKDGEKDSNDNNSEDKKNEVSIKNTKEPVVLSKFININFKGGTKSVFNFINDLEKNSKKLIATEINLNRSEDTSLIGSMKLQYVGYKEVTDISEYKLEIPEIKGKDSPFSPYKGYDEDKKDIKYIGTDYIPKSRSSSNLFLNINSLEDEEPKFIMGMCGRIETELYNNSTSKINGRLTLYEKDGKYICSYTLGNGKRKIDAEVIPQDGTITMDINTKAIIKQEDKISLMLDIDNKLEDISFNIKINNEDINSSRFEVGKKSGKVVIE